MARTAMAKQVTASIRTHMPMVATTNKGMVPRQYTKTSRNTNNGHLRVTCRREMNEMVGRAMAPVAIIRAATPYRAFPGFLCVVVRIVFLLHSHLAPSLIAPRCIVPPVLQTKDHSMLISGHTFHTVLSTKVMVPRLGSNLQLALQSTTLPSYLWRNHGDLVRLSEWLPIRQCIQLLTLSIYESNNTKAAPRDI